MLPRSGFSKQAEGLASGFSISRVLGVQSRSGQRFWHVAPYLEAQLTIRLRICAQSFAAAGQLEGDDRFSDFPARSRKAPSDGKGIRRTRGRRTPAVIRQLAREYAEDLPRSA